MPTRAQIVSIARTFLGTRFFHQGRKCGRGVDCIGLPILVGVELGYREQMEQQGIPVFKCNYDPYPTDDTVLRGMKAWMREVSVDRMKPGDVLCLRCPIPCHAAIVTDMGIELGIIHAYAPNRRVIEHVLNEEWRAKIAGVFMFPDVEE